MDLALALVVAVLIGLVTLVLCGLAGSIARDKGRSYWAFFAFGLLLWFPALLTALLLPDRSDRGSPAGPGRAERLGTAAVLVVGAVAAVAGLAAAVAYAP